MGGSECSNIGFFSDGKSPAVNDKKYPNCEANNLCIFITIPEPVGSKELTVNYKFKTMIRTNKGNNAPKDFKPSEYDVTYAAEVSNINGGANSLVSVKEVGKERQW